MAPHTGCATSEQIDALLNFLEEYKDLARGRLRSLERKLQAKRLWEELSNTLNSMGGCSKTVQQWQNKTLSQKSFCSESRRSASATEGGPSTAPQLSQWELKVLSIMGDGFGERQTGARVPAFGETNDPLPSTFSQSQPPSFPQPLISDEVFPEYVEPSQSQPRQRSEPASQQAQESLSSSRFSQSTHSRRRQSATASDVRSRLYRIEELRAERDTVRNTELAGIRAALSELSGLMREFLNYLPNRI